MSCSAPLAFETLVAYWAGDLSDTEADALDEHLMSCGSCSASSARVQSVVAALRVALPPAVDRATVERLRAAGARIQENTFLPDQRKTVAFPPDLDLLIHRLIGIDLAGVEQVDLTVRSESTGELLVEAPGVPFDAREGVLIACQQHFRNLPADPVFELRALAAAGVARRARYVIPHVY